VAGRDAGLQRQVHLAHPPRAAPFAQQVAQGVGRDGAGRWGDHLVHASILTEPRMSAMTCQVMAVVIGAP
jgi:hypothetical protein